MPSLQTLVVLTLCSSASGLQSLGLVDSAFFSSAMRNSTTYRFTVPEDAANKHVVFYAEMHSGEWNGEVTLCGAEQYGLCEYRGTWLSPVVVFPTVLSTTGRDLYVTVNCENCQLRVSATLSSDCEMTESGLISLAKDEACTIRFRSSQTLIKRIECDSSIHKVAATATKGNITAEVVSTWEGLRVWRLSPHIERQQWEVTIVGVRTAQTEEEVEAAGIVNGGVGTGELIAGESRTWRYRFAHSDSWAKVTVKEKTGSVTFALKSVDFSLQIGGKYRGYAVVTHSHRRRLGEEMAVVVLAERSSAFRIEVEEVNDRLQELIDAAEVAERVWENGLWLYQASVLPSANVTITTVPKSGEVSVYYKVCQRTEECKQHTREQITDGAHHYTAMSNDSATFPAPRDCSPHCVVIVAVLCRSAAAANYTLALRSHDVTLFPLSLPTLYQSPMPLTGRWIFFQYFEDPSPSIAPIPLNVTIVPVAGHFSAKLGLYEKSTGWRWAAVLRSPLTSTVRLEHDILLTGSNLTVALEVETDSAALVTVTIERRGKELAFLLPGIPYFAIYGRQREEAAYFHRDVVGTTGLYLSLNNLGSQKSQTKLEVSICQPPPSLCQNSTATLHSGAVIPVPASAQPQYRVYLSHSGHEVTGGVLILLYAPHTVIYMSESSHLGLVLAEGSALHCLVHITGYEKHQGIRVLQTTVRGDVDLYASWNTTAFPTVNSTKCVASRTYFEENLLIPTDAVIDACGNQTFCPVYVTISAVVDSEITMIVDQQTTKFQELKSGEVVFGQIPAGGIESYSVNIPVSANGSSYITLQPLEGNSDILLWINATFEIVEPGTPTFAGRKDGEVVESIVIAQSELRSKCESFCIIIAEVLCRSTFCTYQLSALTDDVALLAEDYPERGSIAPGEVRYYRFFCAYEVADIHVSVASTTGLRPPIYIRKGLFRPSDTSYNWKADESVLILSSDAVFAEGSMVGYYTVAVGPLRQFSAFEVEFTMDTAQLLPLFVDPKQSYLLPPNKAIYFYHRHFLNRGLKVHLTPMYGEPCMVVKAYNSSLDESQFIYPTSQDNAHSTCGSNDQHSFSVSVRDRDHCVPCVYIIGVLTTNSRSAKFTMYIEREAHRHLNLSRADMDYVRERDRVTYHVDKSLWPVEVTVTAVAGEVSVTLQCLVMNDGENPQWKPDLQGRSHSLVITESQPFPDAQDSVYLTVSGLTDSAYIVYLRPVNATAEVPLGNTPQQVAVTYSAGRELQYTVGEYERCRVRPISPDVMFHVKVGRDGDWTDADRDRQADGGVEVSIEESRKPGLETVLSISGESHPSHSPSDLALLSLTCSNSSYLRLPINTADTGILTPSHGVTIYQLAPAAFANAAVVGVKSCWGEVDFTVSVRNQTDHTRVVLAPDDNGTVSLLGYGTITDALVAIKVKRMIEDSAVFTIWATDAPEDSTVKVPDPPLLTDSELRWSAPVFLRSGETVPSETVRYRLYQSSATLLLPVQTCGIPVPGVTLISEHDLTVTNASVSGGKEGLYIAVVAIIGGRQGMESYVAYPLVASQRSDKEGRHSYIGLVLCVAVTAAGVSAALWLGRRDHSSETSEEELEMRSFAKSYPSYS